MLFYLIPGIIIIACLVAVVIVVVRKFPELASIDVGSIQTEKESLMKDKLMIERLKRKLASAGKLLQVVSPLGNIIKSGFSRVWKKLVKLEEHYRKKDKALKPKEEADDPGEKIIRLLSEAKKKREEGDFTKAEEIYIEILGVDDRNKNAYKGLARVYSDQKDYAHAKEILEHILKIDANDDQVYSNLGLIAKEEGNLEEAKKDYMASLSINSNVADHYADLGEIYKAMDDQDKALKSFIKAVDIEPNNPRYLDILLEASIISKEKDLAKDAFARLKKVNPENQKLDEFRKKIRSI